MESRVLLSARTIMVPLASLAPLTWFEKKVRNHHLLSHCVRLVYLESHLTPTIMVVTLKEGACWWVKFPPCNPSLFMDNINPSWHCLQFLPQRLTALNCRKHCCQLKPTLWQWVCCPMRIRDSADNYRHAVYSQVRIIIGRCFMAMVAVASSVCKSCIRVRHVNPATCIDCDQPNRTPVS